MNFLIMILPRKLLNIKTLFKVSISLFLLLFLKDLREALLLKEKEKEILSEHLYLNF